VEVKYQEKKQLKEQLYLLARYLAKLNLLERFESFDRSSLERENPKKKSE
jgi:hypothetical protein